MIELNNCYNDWSEETKKNNQWFEKEYQTQINGSDVSIVFTHYLGDIQTTTIPSKIYVSTKDQEIKKLVKESLLQPDESEWDRMNWNSNLWYFPQPEVRVLNKNRFKITFSESRERLVEKLNHDRLLYLKKVDCIKQTEKIIKQIETEWRPNEYDSKHVSKIFQTFIDGEQITLLFSNLCKDQNHQILAPARINISSDQQEIKDIFLSNFYQPDFTEYKNLQWNKERWMFKNNPNFTYQFSQYQLRFFPNLKEMKRQLTKEDRLREWKLWREGLPLRIKQMLVPKILFIIFANTILKLFPRIQEK